MGRITPRRPSHRAPAAHPIPDDGRFRELLLYIASVSEGDTGFGLIKLNKLMFFADFLAYLHHGRSITGQEYKALEHGPVPRGVKPMLARMERERALHIRVAGFHGYEQHRPIALREPLLAGFTADQIALVDRIVKQWWGKTAAEISGMSHRFIGWESTPRGATIPYAVALVGKREPTTEERARGLKLEGLARRNLASVRKA